ncbi:hypothetical protein GCM10010448_23590 [Streptomyces glomeratus]|uniref:Secreted protein n=1 Tax=Streptomyces glomeratus TaxID=284452 RepID=A0ABP6LGW7_9ACTN
MPSCTLARLCRVIACSAALPARRVARASARGVETLSGRWPAQVVTGKGSGASRVRADMRAAAPGWSDARRVVVRRTCAARETG